MGLAVVLTNVRLATCLEKVLEKDHWLLLVVQKLNTSPSVNFLSVSMLDCVLYEHTVGPLVRCCGVTRCCCSVSICSLKPLDSAL